jgi:beta-1,4-mannosyl-glycoprotein beta-1,4-N-acetylglucosaminyltransferase
MKVYDCFMYHNEDTILDLRLNFLNEFVDYFVIVESIYNHKGEKKKLNFDIQKYSKFKHKIRYSILNRLPLDIETVSDNDSEGEKSRKYILNGYKRDHFQRNHIKKGIEDGNPEDIILISDIDEIPNLKKINFDSIKNKLILFNQKMCYYKFNLYQKNYNWVGSRACKKKNLISPQWLRDIKAKSYSFWRLDVLLSNKKYIDIFFVENGGWHFSYLNTPQLIDEKLRSYAHHREYELNTLTNSEIETRIKNRQSIYNLNLDQKKNQFSEGVKLDVLGTEELPDYIQSNYKKFEKWLD